jgi:hypothetical protein
MDTARCNLPPLVVERGAYLAVYVGGAPRWLRVRSARRVDRRSGPAWTCDVVVGAQRGVFAREPMILLDSFLRANARSVAEVDRYGWPGPGTLANLDGDFGGGVASSALNVDAARSAAERAVETAPTSADAEVAVQVRERPRSRPAVAVDLGHAPRVRRRRARHPGLLPGPSVSRRSVDALATAIGAAVLGLTPEQLLADAAAERMRTEATGGLLAADQRRRRKTTRPPSRVLDRPFTAAEVARLVDHDSGWPRVHQHERAGRTVPCSAGTSCRKRR